MYNPQVAKEARDFMNYTYIAMIVLGILEALYGLMSIFGGLASLSIGAYFGFGMIGFMGIIWGLLLLAVGAFGVYTALKTIQPNVITKIDQGKYQEAYSVSSSTMTLIIAFITGIIPGILLVLGNQKLTLITGGAAAPPPPPA